MEKGGSTHTDIPIALQTLVLVPNGKPKEESNMTGTTGICPISLLISWVALKYKLP